MALLIITESCRVTVGLKINLDCLRRIVTVALKINLCCLRSITILFVSLFLPLRPIADIHNDELHVCIWDDSINSSDTDVVHRPPVAWNKHPIKMSVSDMIKYMCLYCIIV